MYLVYVARAGQEGPWLGLEQYQFGHGYESQPGAPRGGGSSEREVEAAILPRSLALAGQVNGEGTKKARQY